MELFLGFKNVQKSLFFSINAIINDISENRIGINEKIDFYFENYQFNKKTFHIFFSLFRIYKENLIRRHNIKPYIISLIRNRCSFKKNNCDPMVLKSQKL